MAEIRMKSRRDRLRILSENTKNPLTYIYNKDGQKRSS